MKVAPLKEKQKYNELQLPGVLAEYIPASKRLLTSPKRSTGGGKGTYTQGTYTRTRRLRVP
jgi:hypothetical protein